MGLLGTAGIAALAFAAGAASTVSALYYRDANKAEERLRVAQVLDNELRIQISNNLEPILENLRRQSNDTATALAKVPSNPVCNNTPAANAFDRVVRPDNRSKTNSGQPR